MTEQTGATWSSAELTPAQNEHQMSFVRIMAGSVGRGSLGTTGGFLPAIFALAPLLTGISNICPIGPIFKALSSGTTLTQR